MKNYGLILDKINEKDYLFSGARDREVLIKDGNWTSYLPTGEKQLHLYMDDFGCVSHSAQNVLEMLFNYKIENKLFSDSNLLWLEKKGYIDERMKVNFDDYFTAKLSKTKCFSGNTFRRVADTILKYGLIPQKKRNELVESCKNWYKQVITDEDIELGKEFKKRFKINYETVMRNETNNALQFSPLQVSVNAWYKKNDLYYNTSKSWNHAVSYFRRPTNVNYIFDSYGKQEERSYIKRLTKNYLFGRLAYAYFVEDINNKKDIKIKLYKEKGKSTVFAKGDNMGDDKYHPIGNEDFVMMFSNGWDSLKVEIVKIKSDEIGGMIGSYSWLQTAINNIFNK